MQTINMANNLTKHVIYVFQNYILTTFQFNNFVVNWLCFPEHFR
jgi:hypothetical protein